MGLGRGERLLAAADELDIAGLAQQLAQQLKVFGGIVDEKNAGLGLVLGHQLPPRFGLGTGAAAPLTACQTRPKFLYNCM